jgi:hypothetical protein
VTFLVCLHALFQIFDEKLSPTARLARPPRAPFGGKRKGEEENWSKNKKRQKRLSGLLHIGLASVQSERERERGKALHCRKVGSDEQALLPEAIENGQCPKAMPQWNGLLAIARHKYSGKVVASAETVYSGHVLATIDSVLENLCTTAAEN